MLTQQSHNLSFRHSQQTAHLADQEPSTLKGPVIRSVKNSCRRLGDRPEQSSTVDHHILGQAW